MVALFLGAAPSSYSRPLRVAFVGDPQADGMRQLEYCRKTIYTELRERKDLDLVIVLGDLVNDQIDLLEPTKASLDSLPCPWLCVPGNVTQFAAKDSLSAILSVHPNILVMSGHTHKVERKYLHLENAGAASSSGNDALDIPEVQVGATCGLFWLGVKDETGFPAATMPCGAPRGYFVADFKRNGKYSLAYKAVLRDDVASVWVSGGSTLIVNVFGGAPDGRVSVRIPGPKGWLSASREERPAPEALAVIERNKSIPRKIGKVRNPEYLPMRKTNSPHVWSRVLGSDVDVLKVGTVKIRYRDPVMRFTIQADVKRCP